ncbi:MAG: hypothetical protein J6B12_04525 [Clostridia bacterium]|nr:hypothetical protein [Clostridia bacterium]
MKKLLIALLAVLLCFGLMACNDPADTTGAEDETTTGGDVVDGTDEQPKDTDPVTPETTEPETTQPEETTEPEVVDSDTLSVGEDDGAGFGPINQ